MLHDCLQDLACPPLDLISKYHSLHCLKPLTCEDTMLAPSLGLCLAISFSHPPSHRSNNISSQTFQLDCQPLSYLKRPPPPPPPWAL